MKTAKPKTKSCNCVALIDAQLKDRNARVATRLVLNFKTGDARSTAPLVQLEKIDSKKRKAVPTMVATFCPFCGMREAT